MSKGFSLFESMLAIGLGAVLFMIILKITINVVKLEMIEADVANLLEENRYVEHQLVSALSHHPFENKIIFNPQKKSLMMVSRMLGSHQTKKIEFIVRKSRLYPDGAMYQNETLMMEHVHDFKVTCFNEKMTVLCDSQSTPSAMKWSILACLAGGQKEWRNMPLLLRRFFVFDQGDACLPIQHFNVMAR